MKKRTPKFQLERLECITEVIEAHSYEGYSECFAQISEFLMGKKVILADVKATHAADGFNLRLLLIKDIKDLTDENRGVALATLLHHF